MSYEEEDTWKKVGKEAQPSNIYMPYEEEDTCHMRRRIHVI
jgi:hypothetical protein